MSPSLARGPRSRRWRRLALAVLAVAALYVLAQLLLAAAFDGPVTWTRGMGAFIGGLTGSLTVTWLQRRRLGGREQEEQYARALRSGRLPEDADPAVWRPLLERELRSRRRALVSVVPVTGVFAGAAGLLLAGPFDAGALGLVLAAVGGVLVVAAMSGVVRAQVPRVERLLDQVSDPGTPAS